MKITVGGKEVDLSKSLPMTLGDLRALKKAGVNYPAEFNPRDPDQAATFILHFCRKVDPEIQEADVDSIRVPAGVDVILYLVKNREEELDRPTSGESTDSRTTTGGDPAI